MALVAQFRAAARLDRHRGRARTVARSSGQDGERRPVLSGVGEPGTLCCRQRAVALQVAPLTGASQPSLAANGRRCRNGSGCAGASRPSGVTTQRMPRHRMKGAGAGRSARPVSR
jgi:hypothetical protein